SAGAVRPESVSVADPGVGSGRTTRTERSAGFLAAGGASDATAAGARRPARTAMVSSTARPSSRVAVQARPPQVATEAVRIAIFRMVCRSVVNPQGRGDGWQPQPWQRA